MRFPLTACAVFLIVATAAVAAESYQSAQREKAWDSWRQRTYFEDRSRTSTSSSNNFNTPATAQRDYSAEVALREQQRRVETQYRLDLAAWERKLAAQEAQEKVRHARAYENVRNQLGGRLPLHEAPAFNSDEQRMAWYRDQASRADASDSFVLWYAAVFAVNLAEPGTSLTEARRWIERADRGWPEVQSLLGRMLVLGEGGQRDVVEGWKLLNEAEPAYRNQERSALGRPDLYYALGRAYADGLGVKEDPIQALVRFDQNAAGKLMHGQSYRYLINEFWPRHAAHAAQLVVAASAAKETWNYGPLGTLNAAAQQPRSPAQLTRERAENGFVAAQVFDFGQPELIRQTFLALNPLLHRGTAEGRADALKDIDEWLAKGVTRIAVERLLPDAYGDFLNPADVAEQTRWLTAGQATLDELASNHDGRALAAKAWFALHPPNASPDFEHAAVAAEAAIAAGDPWGAAYFLAALSEKSAVSEPLQARAAAMLQAAAALPVSPLTGYTLGRFLSDHARSQPSWSEAFWQASARAGHSVSARVLVDLYQERRVGKLGTAAADEALWQKAEAVLAEAQAACTNEREKADLAQDMTIARAQHARYASKVRSQLDPRYAHDEYVARVAQLSAHAIETLAEHWRQIAARLEDPQATWDWSEEHVTAPEEDRLISEEDRRRRYLVAACDNAAGVLSRQIRLLPAVLEQTELGSGETPFRPLVVAAFERFAATNARAAVALGRKLGPSHEYPALTRSLASEQHAIKWLRHAIALGDGSAAVELRNYFSSQPELAALYDAAAGVPSADDTAAVIAALPTPELESATLARTYADLQASRAELEQMIAKEVPTAEARIRTSMTVLTRAAGAAHQTEFFKNYDEHPDDPTEGALLSLSIRPEITRVLLARYLDAVARGQCAYLESATRFMAEAERPALIAAVKGLVESAANRDDVAAIKYLIEANLPGTIEGWPASELESVKWVRRALLLGEVAYIDVPAQLYGGALNSRLWDVARRDAWAKFRDAYSVRFPGEALATDAAAFARDNLPPD